MRQGRLNGLFWEGCRRKSLYAEVAEGAEAAEKDQCKDLQT